MSVLYLSDPLAWQTQENEYTSLRKREGWLSTDEELKSLPQVQTGHPLMKEWKMRNDSFQKLLVYLKSNRVHTITDLGCGNGWMSHLLTQQGFEVKGIDINEKELLQADRVFSHPNLDWIFADVFHAEFTHSSQVVIISAALQYFEKPKELFKTLFKKLMAKEIIVMDTNFYNLNEVLAAKKRSELYYKSMNADFMIDTYFHHTFEDIKPFQVKFVYKARKNWLSKLLTKSPFPIISISQSREE